MKNIIITIDGPAGAGKTDTAKLVAKRLNLIHYNSGYSYRAITLALINNNLINKDYNSKEIVKFVNEINIKNKGNTVFLDDEDVTAQLKTSQIDANVPEVAKIGHIRNKTKEILLDFATSGVGLVVEGRDIGTVVLPHADVKIFLTASLDIRALRRLEQISNLSFSEVYESIKERDDIDSSREIAPLKMPEDSFLLDNTDLTKEETVEHIVGIARGLKKIRNIEE
ncbi:cytidylate kinase [Tubulinosema ratisbonensis]|uniref:(d)CMP kinase n=1 Tax=Tubulinosema ratisbonensis TaxID=291195 RepID=A0A437AMJ9_9MICR|nr:cytidylate kinase [Tubulinosema ratisbonensis]